jgi:hypothetical protein
VKQGRRQKAEGRVGFSERLCEMPSWTFLFGQAYFPVMGVVGVLALPRVGLDRSGD